MSDMNQFDLFGSDNAEPPAIPTQPFFSAINPLENLQKDAGLADGEARFEAISPAQSFIVQAPAGSGKTALLTQRFLALLSQVEAPEQIVAMTFTKKAAAEMRERIFEALQLGRQPFDAQASLYEQNTWQLAQAALQRDAQGGWQLLQNPNRLRIRTIDSMNGYLVQQMPLLSRLGAQPQMAMMDDSHYLKAVRAALKDESASEAVASLLQLVNGAFHRAENLLVTMLKKRDQWMGNLWSVDGDDRAAMEASLGLLIEQETRQACQSLDKALPILQEMVMQAEVAHTNGCDWLTPLLGQTLNLETEAEVWQALGKWVLTTQGTFRKTANKNQGFPPAVKDEKALFVNGLQALLEMDGKGELSAALARLVSLPSAHYSDDQWQQLVDLIALLKLCVAHLKLTFQTSGEADFIEVAQAASQALGTELEPTDLAQQLDYRLKHLLIDEFQDTSVAQYDLVKKLVAGWTPDDGHSVFIVGDPMQSIYRFREAEVGNFLQAWQGSLGEVTLRPLNLTVNFRSAKGVVDWVNQTFQKVFPRESVIEKGAVAYAPALAFSEDTTAAVQTHWHFNLSPEEEAQAALELIEDALPDLPDGQSIGVLGRSRSHLMGIATLLKQAQIPFRAVELEGLKDRQEVQDCEALTRALVHLGDRPAWIALLRSPLVGLSLKDLYALLGENDDYFQTPVWQSLLAFKGEETSSDKHAEKGEKQVKNHQAWCFLSEKTADLTVNLSEEGRARLQFAAPILEAALQRVGQMPMAQWVRETWLQLDGAQTVTSESALQNVEAYCQMLSGLVAGSHATLTPRQLETTLEQLYALPDASDASGRIELMTMHKSKGLEFDTVILPGLARRPRGDDKALIAWLAFKVGASQTKSANASMDDENHLLIAPLEQRGKTASKAPGLVDLIRRYEQEKGLYELGRLLYVAVTRAKRRLHLLASLSVTEKQLEKDQPLKPTEKSLLACLWSCEASAYEQALMDYEFEDEEEAVEAAWPKVSRLPLERSHFAEPTSMVLSGQANTHVSDDDDYSASGQVSGQISETDSAQVALLATSVGNLVHGVLEQCASDNPNLDLVNLSARLSDQEAVYQHWLALQGLQGKWLDTALQRVMRSLRNACGNERLQWALQSSHAESAVELALSSLESEQDWRYQANHIMDRTFVDEQGVRWIVDYKTSYLNESASREERSDFIAEQVANYQQQLARYGKLFEALETREQKWVLYFSYLDEWVEVPAKKEN